MILLFKIRSILSDDPVVNDRVVPGIMASEEKKINDKYYVTHLTNLKTRISYAR